MDSEWLLQRLSEFQDRTALIWRGDEYSYNHLLQRVSDWRKVLEERQVTAGECVAMHGGFSPATTTLLIALVANGNIVVPLTTPSAAERDRCLQIAHAGPVFQFDQADSWEFFRRDPGEKNALLEDYQKSREPGLILLSSGSTGQIKAALHSFPRLLDHYRKPRAALRTLAFLLLDHVGGINTLFNILCSGGTVVALAERAPEAICQAVEHYQVQLLPTTPTFLRMLLISEAYKKFNLSSLQLITYGTEPMPLATLESLNQALPGVRLKQTYGLTEVGILSTKSENNDSLWLAVGGEGYETKIVDGVLWIRAQSAMLGYLNAPSPFDADGWMNTGDLVEQKGDYIRFLGRKSEIINVGGEKVFPAEVENVIQQIENVKEVTVRGRRNPITGNVIVATVEVFQPEDPKALEQRIRQVCRERLAPFKVPAMIELASGSLCGERFKKIRRVKKKEE